MANVSLCYSGPHLSTKIDLEDLSGRINENEAFDADGIRECELEMGAVLKLQQQENKAKR